MEEYPVEWKTRALPVVALLGGTGLHNTIAQVVSTVRTEEGTDVPCFRFLSLELDVTKLARNKPRRTSYDSIAPLGIIKSSWLNKHLFLLPSVAALFFLFEERSWKQTETEILNHLELLKGVIRNKPPKWMVVIVQKNGLTDPASDEKITPLRKRADQLMETKTVFFIFNKDDIKHSVKRLEDSLRQLSILYYKEEARRLKKERERLNKQIQPYLLVRFSFKIAFYNELMQKFESAKKYYLQAYQYIRDMFRNPRAAPEIKAVAELINYKLCRLYFFSQTNTNNPDGVIEAIAQFQRHIKTWKNFIGPTDREYEHWAWIARQYTSFGEMIRRIQFHN